MSAPVSATENTYKDAVEETNRRAASNAYTTISTFEGSYNCEAFESGIRQTN